MSINVAITGSFCSGKTYVCQQFMKSGFRIFSTDAMVHELLRKKEVKKKIRKIFGEDAFSGRVVERKKLADAAFKERSSWLRLNSILHPEVIKKVKALMRSGRRDEKNAFEVPLLFEAGMEPFFDAVIYVKARRDIRVKRAAKRGFSSQDISLRSRFLINERIKVKKSDWVLDNSGTRESLNRKIKDIICQLKQKEMFDAKSQ